VKTDDPDGKIAQAVKALIASAPPLDTAMTERMRYLLNEHPDDRAGATLSRRCA
jgi:hypothetical protein